MEGDLSFFAQKWAQTDAISATMWEKHPTHSSRLLSSHCHAPIIQGHCRTCGSQREPSKPNPHYSEMSSPCDTHYQSQKGEQPSCLLLTLTKTKTQLRSERLSISHIDHQVWKEILKFPVALSFAFSVLTPQPVPKVPFTITKYLSQ